MLGIDPEKSRGLSVAETSEVKELKEASVHFQLDPMVVPEGLEGVKLSQQALLDLERSKVPPVELLDEVAQILGVNYRHIRSRFFGPGCDNNKIAPTAYCAAKEEWALRWLLKRLGLSGSGGKIKMSSRDSLR
jgi:transcriptional regulator with XRE-family HTH domain